MAEPPRQPNHPLMLELTVYAAGVLGVTHGKRGKRQNPYAKPKGRESAEVMAHRRRMSKAYQTGYKREYKRWARRQKRSVKST